MMISFSELLSLDEFYYTAGRDKIKINNF